MDELAQMNWNRILPDKSGDSIPTFWAFEARLWLWAALWGILLGGLSDRNEGGVLALSIHDLAMQRGPFCAREYYFGASCGKELRSFRQGLTGMAIELLW